MQNEKEPRESEGAQQNCPIDKIIVMSLDRTENRQDKWDGASAIMGIDPALVEVAIGHDNKSFGDDMQAVAEAATEDGFPWVVDYARGMKTDYCQQTAASVCQIWNYCRILRELKEQKKTGLIIFDDKMITLQFDLLMELVTEVQSVEDVEFLALQLMLRGSKAELRLPELTFELRSQMSREIYSGIVGKPVNEYRELFLQHGITGYDETFVFSPAGAEWFLKCLDLAPDYYMYLDHFICQAMPAFAQQAINRGKGVYCPSEVGYKFVDTFMELGTTTDWAPEGSPGYEQSVKAVKRQYFFGDALHSPENKDIKTPHTSENKGAKDLRAELDEILKS